MSNTNENETENSMSMSLGIGPITDSIISEVSKRLKKSETREKIKQSFGPIIDDMISPIYNYYMLPIILLFIIIVLQIYIIYKHKKN